ncbi:branched-chain amino acid ABC transporter permease [Bradyrhizobium japonicum]|uniref:branched-chain amino acid ABC transporter permease n=1 Tax=Bradyrhizobium japonicum TaxID=375 RepID=UPI000417B00E|nr:branched-chain amino acid ABC transporter permease [Bradyrhizobium japonicum]MCS3897145.1 branched-chain amino acid transport system permease protein [Bradyrhizobium japonicum USDA 38]MCS3949660.1 branched-chain amino acid transport system permease protein [Bradyrhizobium japonicum]UQD76360.1 branched-chain amino acid ABC transporter permease [Bradyrhizobium japonicum]
MNIAQQIINGIVLGSGYACIALGWTILLGVARLVNFAHGQLYMLGAFVTWYAITKLGLPYPLAILVAIVVLGVIGLLMQSAMMRLVMTQNLTSLMIVTLGLGYVLQGGSALIFGGNPQTLPGTLARAKIDIGPLWFTWQDVLVLVVTLLLYGAVWLFTQRTRFGSVIRAVAEDPKLAELFGINAKFVYLGVFVFECSAVALGAALVAPRSPILTSMGFNEVIMTFVVVVLGGIGSIGGALAAGLGLGLFTAFFGAFVAPAYTTAAAFALLLALLVIRPAGLATK